MFVGSQSPLELSWFTQTANPGRELKILRPAPAEVLAQALVGHGEWWLVMGSG